MGILGAYFIKSRQFLATGIEYGGEARRQLGRKLVSERPNKMRGWAPRQGGYTFCYGRAMIRAIAGSWRVAALGENRGGVDRITTRIHNARRTAPHIQSPTHASARQTLR